MRYSSCTSRTIGVTVGLAAAVALTSAAPTSLDFVRPAPRESRLGTVSRSNRDSMLNQRDVEVYGAASVGHLRSTSTDHIARHTIMAQPTLFMSSPPGGVLLESPSSAESSLTTPNMMIVDSCSTTINPLNGLGYHVAVLVLLACTLGATTFIVCYLVRRQRLLDRLRNRNPWPSANLYSPSDTPNRKPPLSISVPDADRKAPLKHKISTSTLSSITEEPGTPDRKVSFASPRDSSRPPSYAVSYPDNPAPACFPLSPSSPSQRTIAEGQSSFLPLR